MINRAALVLASTIIAMALLDAPPWLAVLPITLNMAAFLYSLNTMYLYTSRIPGIRYNHDKVYTLKEPEPRE